MKSIKKLFSLFRKRGKSCWIKKWKHDLRSFSSVQVYYNCMDPAKRFEIFKTGARGWILRDTIKGIDHACLSFEHAKSFSRLL